MRLEIRVAENQNHYDSIRGRAPMSRGREGWLGYYATLMPIHQHFQKNFKKKFSKNLHMSKIISTFAQKFFMAMICLFLVC